MKTYVHSRLTKEDRAVLDDLKQSTGCSESDLVRRGLHLAHKEWVRKPQSARELAGDSVGKFKKGPRDLVSNKKRLEGFGR